MKAHPDTNEVVQELVENIQSATWKDLEPREPPTSVRRFLESINSGRVLVHGPIIIQEKEPTNESP